MRIEIIPIKPGLDPEWKSLNICVLNNHIAVSDSKNLIALYKKDSKQITYINQAIDESNESVIAHIDHNGNFVFALIDNKQNHLRDYKYVDKNFHEIDFNCDGYRPIQTSQSILFIPEKESEIIVRSYDKKYTDPFSYRVTMPVSAKYQAHSPNGNIVLYKIVEKENSKSELGYLDINKNQTIHRITCKELLKNHPEYIDFEVEGVSISDDSSQIVFSCKKQVEKTFFLYNTEKKIVSEFSKKTWHFPGIWGHDHQNKVLDKVKEILDCLINKKETVNWQSVHCDFVNPGCILGLLFDTLEDRYAFFECKLNRIVTQRVNFNQLTQLTKKNTGLVEPKIELPNQCNKYINLADLLNYHNMQLPNGYHIIRMHTSNLHDSKILAIARHKPTQLVCYLHIYFDQPIKEILERYAEKIKLKKLKK